MSMDPSMIAQMLMQKGQGGGQNPSTMGTAANLLQQVLMAQQLKQRLGGQDPNQQQMPPNPTMMGAPGLPGQAQPQAMNQLQLPGATSA